MTSIDHSHMGAISDSELLQIILEIGQLQSRRDVIHRMVNSLARKMAETLADGYPVTESDIIRYRALRKKYRAISHLLKEES